MNYKKILLIITLIFGFYFLLIINVKAAISMDAKQRAIRDTAYAYFYKGKAIQYDSALMNFQSGTHKKPRNGSAFSNTISPLLYFPPEQATTQDPKYVVCSTFVENVYYETFQQNGKGFYFKSTEGIQTQSEDLVKFGRKCKNSSCSSYLTGYKVENNKVVALAGDYCSNTCTLGRCSRNINGHDKISYYDAYNNLVVYYRSCLNGVKWSDSLSDSKKNEIIFNMYDELLSVIKPGDIIVRTTRKNGSVHGHAVLYFDVKGDIPLIIDANGKGITDDGDDINDGGKYDFNTMSDLIEPTGALSIKEMAVYGKNTSSNCTKSWKTSKCPGKKNIQSFFGGSVDELVVLRPLNVISGSYALTNNAKNRTNYDYLNTTMVANRDNFESISLNDTILYTITLENKSSSTTYSNIVVNAQIPDNTTYVNASDCTTGNKCIVSGKTVSWTVSISAGKTKTLSYRVKVNNSKSLYNTYIVNNNTTINGIKAKNIKTLILPAAPKYNNKNIADYVKSFVGQKINDESAFLSKVYSNDFGFSSQSPYKLINILFVHSKTENIYKLRKYTGATAEQKKYLQMVVQSPYKEYLNEPSNFGNDKIPGLFGGVQTYTAYNPKLYDGRIYTFIGKTESNGFYTYTAKEFMEGDILLISNFYVKVSEAATTNYEKTAKAYVYVGNSQFVTYDSNYKIVLLSQAESNELIGGLLAEECFVVLRPRNGLSTAAESVDYLEEDIIEQDDNKNEVVVDNKVDNKIVDREESNTFVDILPFILIIVVAIFLPIVINKTKNKKKK